MVFDNLWWLMIYDDWWSMIINDICHVIFWQASAVSYLFYFLNFRLQHTGILHPSWNFSGSTSLDRLFLKARNDGPGATGYCPSSCWRSSVTLGPDSDCPEPVGPKVKSWLDFFFGFMRSTWSCKVSFLGKPCLESNLEHLQKLERLPSWSGDLQKKLKFEPWFFEASIPFVSCFGGGLMVSELFFQSSFLELLPFLL